MCARGDGGRIRDSAPSAAFRSYGRGRARDACGHYLSCSRSAAFSCSLRLPSPPAAHKQHMFSHTPAMSPKSSDSRYRYTANTSTFPSVPAFCSRPCLNPHNLHREILPRPRPTRRRRCEWRTGQSRASRGPPPWAGCPANVRGQRPARAHKDVNHTCSKIPNGRPMVTQAFGESCAETLSIHWRVRAQKDVPRLLRHDFQPERPRAGGLSAT